MADLMPNNYTRRTVRDESSRVSGGEPDSGQWLAKRQKAKATASNRKSDAQPLCDDHHRC